MEVETTLSLLFIDFMILIQASLSLWATLHGGRGGGRQGQVRQPVGEDGADGGHVVGLGVDPEPGYFRKQMSLFFSLSPEGSHLRNQSKRDE